MTTRLFVLLIVALGLVCMVLARAGATLDPTVAADTISQASSLVVGMLVVFYFLLRQHR